MGQACTYTYIASSLDGRASFLDLRTIDDQDEMVRHAQRLLADHHSCDRVEIWTDSLNVAVVTRDDGAAAGARV